MEIFMNVSSVKRVAANRDRYLKLVQTFPLKHLRSDRELREAIKVIKSLIIRGKLACGEQDYLDVLTDIVERYESEHCPMSPVSDAEMLRQLIEARAVTQAQLSAGTGISMSSISEILHGKKNLTRRHIGILAKYFGVTPAVFIA
jgi:HTH-type transcriptional regulator / antitoxin HigA